MTEPFRLERGAVPLASGGVRFSVWAPFAKRVSVLVRTAGATVEAELEPRPGGLFEGVVAAATRGCDYRYRLDERLERADPVSRHQPDGVHGPSRVVDPDAFRWTDSAWRGIEVADLILYELHVGTFSRSGTFEGVVERLSDLRELGVTAIELMPVAQFPGERNWGYDGVFPYAPQDSYGGPEGLRRLVDAAHAAGLAVLLDVVYNHLGPEGNVLHDFGPYFTERYRTPWGAALNFDQADSDEVRRFFVDNACYWIAEYHLDGLRLDAVHAILDTSAHHLLAETAERVHRLGDALGRRVLVIAESDLNDPRLVRPAERGGYGLDASWSDDFHHAVHAALTGERSGYYVDFGGADAIVKALNDRFVYDGGHSGYRRRRHGAPARDVPAQRFVVCIQNHDQIGNRARGDRLATLLPPGRLRLAASVLLLSPFVPLLFMGEEYGETQVFAYFVSHHDPDLVEAVRRGRQEEFAAFAWQGSIPDPASVETFESARLRPERATEPGHRELLALYGELLRLRREEPLLRPGAAAVEATTETGAPWWRTEYRSEEARAFAAFQLGSQAASVPVPASARGWRLRLASEDTAFGGGGGLPPERLAPSDGVVLLPPNSSAFYREAS